jgi:fructose-1,6-bisphosphatase/inositol monophosphatase family enzyme
MKDTEQEEYLNFAQELARVAGTVMRKYYGKRPDERLKSDNTIVTIADEEINQMVIDRVAERYPEHAVHGEESSSENNSDYVWVCDPIDGTNPFSMEVPVSVFSLALVVDGTPQVGVIYAPFSEHMYTASKGGGSYLNNEPIHVRETGFDVKARMNVDWWVDAKYDVMTPMHRLAYDKNVYILCPGSTTHAGALVARGEFVASIFPGTKGKNVDIAAAKVIVEEAGGKVTDFFGNEQRYDEDLNGAVLSNGIVHDEIIKYLTEDFGGKR